MDERKLTLYLHTLRDTDEHPAKQATFSSNSGKPNLGSKRRVGRPKINWIEANQRKAWNMLKEKHPIPEITAKRYKSSSKFIQDWIHTAANLRLIP